MRKIHLLLGAILILASSCQKEDIAKNIRTYTGPEICRKIDSLKSLYACQMEFEFDTTSCTLSDDAFMQIERLIIKESSRKSGYGTKSAELDEGDDSELIIHCVTAYAGNGGNDIIGTGLNNITSYKIKECDGYHLNGTPPNVIHRKEGCVYFQVEFNALYYPFAYITFSGIFEFDRAADFIDWVEDDMMYVSGTWDWDPGKLKYFYNEVALASEYYGKRKDKVIDKVTGGWVSYYVKQRFIFVIFNLNDGEDLDYTKPQQFTMRGYFAND